MPDNRKFTPGCYGLPAPEPEPAPTVKWDGITWVPCDAPQAPPQPAGYSGGWVFQGGQFVPLAGTEPNDDTVIADRQTGPCVTVRIGLVAWTWDAGNRELVIRDNRGREMRVPAGDARYLGECIGRYLNANGRP